MACSNSALLADAPGQEQVIEHQQVGLDPALEQRRLLGVLASA
jgi:hypothetical protein